MVYHSYALHILRVLYYYSVNILALEALPSVDLCQLYHVKSLQYFLESHAYCDLTCL